MQKNPRIEKKDPFPLRCTLTQATHNTHHTHTKMDFSVSSAAASSSSSSAAINDVDSVVPDEEESSDLVVSSDDDVDDDAYDDDYDDLENEFFLAARDIQNRMSRNVGTAQMEDRRFRELYGARMEIVVHLWVMMDDDDLLPPKSKPKHLLWTLFFLKVYPREGPGCSAVGGLGGAVDPKTLQKWVWLFIERIGELADKVVSVVYCRVPSTVAFSPLHPLRPSDRLREQARRRPRRGQRLPNVR